MDLADAATQALGSLINTKSDQMEQEIGTKTDTINNLIADLTENFIARFWE